MAVRRQGLVYCMCLLNSAARGCLFGSDAYLLMAVAVVRCALRTGRQRFLPSCCMSSPRILLGMCPERAIARANIALPHITQRVLVDPSDCLPHRAAKLLPDWRGLVLH